jgi:hypothetical protein
MIGQGLYFDLLFRKPWDITEILAYGISIYFKKYRYIETAREISISLSIYPKIFGNIVIVIDIEIPNIAQPWVKGVFTRCDVVGTWSCTYSTHFSRWSGHSNLLFKTF